MIEIKEGDLLESTEKYICHQCNCLTDHAAGIAYQIFKTFPHSDVYAPRKHVIYSPQNLIKGQEPGDIIVCGDGKDYRYVINMFAQLYPGKPRFPDSAKDGFAARQRYFRQCLDKIIKISDLNSIAFPYNIGCNLAGGSWEHYYQMLEEFAKKLDSIPVVVYKID